MDRAPRRSQRLQRKDFSESGQVPFYDDAPEPNILKNDDNLSDISHISQSSAKVILKLMEQHRKDMEELRNEVRLVKIGKGVGHEEGALIDKHFNDRGEHTPVTNRKSLSQEPDRIPDPTSSLLSSVNNLMLPNFELESFEGNPADFIRFTRQFENYVESKISDPGQRLMQLIYYCKGKAKDCIKECVMLRPIEGYARARTILRQRFGKPYHVARSMIAGLLNMCKRQRGDASSLMDLAIKMQSCSIAFGEMRLKADLNASHILEAIVKTLPHSLQSKWADEANRISFEDREPEFDELAAFLM